MGVRGAPLRVLGLDPGSRRTGWGVVEAVGGHRLLLVEAGVIDTGREDEMPRRLLVICQGLRQVIDRLRPLEMAAESVFAARNVRSALVLGQARGAALVAAADAGLPVFEYTPAAVKKALVGNGRAAKEQVRAMVGALLRGGGALPLDASDALAVAMTHLQCRSLAARGIK